MLENKKLFDVSARVKKPIANLGLDIFAAQCLKHYYIHSACLLYDTFGSFISSLGLMDDSVSFI